MLNMRYVNVLWTSKQRKWRRKNVEGSMTCWSVISSKSIIYHATVFYSNYTTFTVYCPSKNINTYFDSQKLIYKYYTSMEILPFDTNLNYCFINKIIHIYWIINSNPWLTFLKDKINKNTQYSNIVITPLDQLWMPVMTYANNRFSKWKSKKF